MAASTWRKRLEPVVRPEDEERIGYLRQHDDDRWEPLNLLGIAVGTASTRDDAMSRVHVYAMPSLLEPWWARIPRPLTETIDARSVGENVEWDRVVVAEVTADRAMMRPMYAWPEESGRYLIVDLPADDVVFEREPVESI